MTLKIKLEKISYIQFSRHFLKQPVNFMCSFFLGNCDTMHYSWRPQDTMQLFMQPLLEQIKCRAEGYIWLVLADGGCRQLHGKSRTVLWVLYVFFLICIRFREENLVTIFTGLVYFHYYCWILRFIFNAYMWRFPSTLEFNVSRDVVWAYWGRVGGGGGLHSIGKMYLVIFIIWM